MIQIGAVTATVDSPIEHLVACHRRIEQRLETLVNAAGSIETDRIAALGAIEKSLEFLETSGALHTQDEEISLFPRLRKKLSAPETAFVDSLETQHAEADGIYSELKQLARQLRLEGECSPDLIGRYRECAARLRLLYRAHISAEDEILTALARRSLDEFEIAQISLEMQQRRAIPGKPNDPTARPDPRA